MSTSRPAASSACSENLRSDPGAPAAWRRRRPAAPAVLHRRYTVSEAPTIYSSEPLQVYLDDAASKKPAPGGGSVSACAGALGAALVGMVCNLTREREKFADVETEIVTLVEAAEAARARLEQLLHCLLYTSPSPRD